MLVIHSFSCFFMCWSWDTPIVMRFIYTYFDRIPFVIFNRTIPEWHLPWAFEFEFKESLLIGSLNCKRMTFSCTGHVYLEILNHWIVKSRWINFACSLKNLIWGLFVKNKQKKKLLLWHLCYTWFFFPTDVLFSVNAIAFFFLLFFFHFWRFDGNPRHICLSNVILSTDDALLPLILSPLAFLQPSWFVHVRRETALNHACSLWQRCLWTVYGHGLTWRYSNRKKKKNQSKNLW